MAPRTQPPSSEIAELKKEIRKPGTLPYAKVCAYGINGSGKTRLGGSAENVLLLDFNEEGDRSIKDRDKARVLPVPTWTKVGNAYWYLKSGKHPFKAVCLDTVTEMGNIALEFVLGEAEDRDPTRERSSPTKRDYGRAAVLMRGMLLAYRNLPMHVIFLAQERRIRDPDTEEVIEITVDLPAGSRGTAMGGVGILGRMESKEVVVRRNGKKVREWHDHLRVGPHEVIQTKDRTYSLGDVFRDPTMDKIIKLWTANPPTNEED